MSIIFIACETNGVVAITGATATVSCAEAAYGATCSGSPATCDVANYMGNAVVTCVAGTWTGTCTPGK